MPKFKDVADNIFTIRQKKPNKYKKVNPKTNRMKTFRKTKYVTTKIKPEDRSFKNIPKYADGKTKVSFQEWMEIKHGKLGFGKAANGKWYGWSHRAVYGFKAGDKVENDSLGKKVTYGKFEDGTTDFDSASYEDDFVIKNDDQAKQVAMTFHDNVA